MVYESAGLMIPNLFGWSVQVNSLTSNSPTVAFYADLFCSPILGFYECDKLSAIAVDEEDVLFAGLGELPECFVVFRRGFLE